MAAAPKTKRWLTAVAAALLSAGIAELFCRLVLPPPGFEPRAPSYPPGLYELHPVRGYSYAPNAEVRIETANFSTEVRTNSLGLRGSEPSSDFTGDTILALGDSLTAGWGVAFEQAWPARLEHRLRTQARQGNDLRVVTAAVPGYNARQIRLLAAEYVPRFRPRLIVAGIYPYGSSRMFDPFVLVDGQLFQDSSAGKVEPVAGGFVITPFEGQALLRADDWMRERFRFGGYLLRAASAAIGRARRSIRWQDLSGGPSAPDPHRLKLEPLLGEILAMREIARSHGAEFVAVLTTPQDGYGHFPGDDRRYTDLILQFASQNQIPCYSPLAEMEGAANGLPVFRLRGDAHWNARGHDFAAAGLHRFLKETGLTPEQPVGNAARN